MINWKAIILVLAAAATVPSASATDRDDETINGRIEQSLFRFPASKLGSGFDDILKQWYEDWLRVPPGASRTRSGILPAITPEPAGLSHAFESVSTPAATLFRRQCYGPAPVTPRLSNQYSSYEGQRKEIAFQYNPDPMEETRLLHTLTNRIYPAFLPGDDGDRGSDDTRRAHKKKSASTVNTVYARTTLPDDRDSPRKLSFQTVHPLDQYSPDKLKTQQWSWNPPAHFSSRGAPDNKPFRHRMYAAMRVHLEHHMREARPSFRGFDYGRQSGMFWYPPGGAREWHNNGPDLIGRARDRSDYGGASHNEKVFGTQVWRMYFVRTVRDPEFDGRLARLRGTDGCDGSGDDHSAMHIIPGGDAGITLDVLRKAGARPLTKEEEARQWSDEFAANYTAPDDAKEDDGDANDGELDRRSVWRIPDRDGYVTIFRLPDIWHCIVSEEVHRYSLGFALSDREVQALLKMAEVPYDVVGGRAAHDEL